MSLRLSWELGPTFHRVCVSFALLVAPGLVASGSTREASAQELPFRPDYPGSSAFECRPRDPPRGVERSEAARAKALAPHATASLVLGDLSRARDLLVQAVELDAGSADLLDRLSRVQEELGAHEDAVASICRALAARADGEELPDAHERIERLLAALRQSLPAPATAAFDRATQLARGGLIESAAVLFEEAAAHAPSWPLPAYNHGAALDRLGRTHEAIAELRRYLALEPEADDAVTVSRRIGQLEAATIQPALPSPGVVLSLGLLAPGMGHVYAGRPTNGLLVLSLAGGAVAAGMLIRDVRVRCLVVPESGSACPPEWVVSREQNRPYLVWSAVAAGLLTVAAAVDAYLDAGGEAAARLASRVEPEGPGLAVTLLSLPAP